jgi:hypothetical protein
MSVKRFKFVSPGVFINEIDNSSTPQTAVARGPVIIGRARRGPGMRPIKIESYSQFVTTFGETVPGNMGGDIYRDGNLQSPMYGTYAARAFLNANVAPLTYIRLLGEQTVAGKAASSTAGASAGWKTNLNPAAATAAAVNAGGAYGLWVFASASTPNSGLAVEQHTASLGAIIYCQNGHVALSGSVYGGMLTNTGGGLDWTRNSTTASLGALICSDTNGVFNLQVSTSVGTTNAAVDFNDSSDNFIRDNLNTNPQLAYSGSFYPTNLRKNYFLGESYEQALRDAGLVTTGSLVGLVYPIALSGTAATGPQNMLGQASRDAVAGWFIAQDTGPSANYYPQNMQKLFRVLGRGQGEWLHKNVKVSIERIRQSNTATSDYGTFSLILRDIRDTDNNVMIMERFDNLSLNPASPNFISRRIGDQYTQWDQINRRLKTYGEYYNKSSYIRVEVNSDVEAGASDASLLPFGYFGPPRFESVTGIYTMTPIAGGAGRIPAATGPQAGQYVWINQDQEGGAAHLDYDRTSTDTFTATPFLTGTAIHTSVALSFPYTRLRVSASAGKLTDQTDAYFGFMSTRTVGSTSPGIGLSDPSNLMYANIVDDPVTSPPTGVDAYSYVFSLDDVVSGSTGGYYWNSGSRNGGTSVTSASCNDILNADFNRFTAPFWGGSDGFDITKPDPMYNKAMNGSSTEDNSYVYNTWRRSIDTIADPDYIDMNLMAAPGLTLDSLTTHAVRTSEARGDTLAIIDLPDVYIPSHEYYYANKSERRATTPVQSANALKDRRLDSSYGAVYYPWVQARDENTGANLWVPPSVAALGVLASSEKTSGAIWFAPAGYNRGTISKGAAGITISGISEQLDSDDRDTLYNARINPIPSFPNSGIVVFGQKTLQERASALDRINVRRLVIYLKKEISILSTQVLFEQNVPDTWLKFKSLVEPLLSSTLAGYGITDYKLVLDESTTTPDLIDQNIMYAKIMVKPARAIEYIAIDFVITNTGASFED